MQDRLRWLRKENSSCKNLIRKSIYEYWIKSFFTLKHVTITITGHVMWVYGNQKYIAGCIKKIYDVFCNAIGSQALKENPSFWEGP